MNAKDDCQADNHTASTCCNPQTQHNACAPSTDMQTLSTPTPSLIVFMCVGGGDADGTEYANVLAQASFRAVAVAANDVAAVFQKDAPELSSLFLVWALQETQRQADCPNIKCATVANAESVPQKAQVVASESNAASRACICIRQCCNTAVCPCRCTQLLKQHALSPFAVPAGLGPTVQCCIMALLYCTALETSHSLMLSPRLMRDLWPTCEQVADLNDGPMLISGKAEVSLAAPGLAECCLASCGCELLLLGALTSPSHAIMLHCSSQ